PVDLPAGGTRRGAARRVVAGDHGVRVGLVEILPARSTAQAETLAACVDRDGVLEVAARRGIRWKEGAAATLQEGVDRESHREARRVGGDGRAGIADAGRALGADKRPAG